MSAEDVDPMRSESFISTSPCLEDPNGSQQQELAFEDNDNETAECIVPMSSTGDESGSTPSEAQEMDSIPAKIPRDAGNDFYEPGESTVAASAGKEPPEETVDEGNGFVAKDILEDVDAEFNDTTKITESTVADGIVNGIPEEPSDGGKDPIGKATSRNLPTKDSACKQFPDNTPTILDEEIVDNRNEPADEQNDMSDHEVSDGDDCSPEYDSVCGNMSEEKVNPNFLLPSLVDGGNSSLSLEQLIVLVITHSPGRFLNLAQICAAISSMSASYDAQGAEKQINVGNIEMYGERYPWIGRVAKALRRYDFPTEPVASPNDGRLYFVLPPGREWSLLNTNCEPCRELRTYGRDSPLGIMDIPPEIRLKIYTWVLRHPLGDRQGWATDADYTLNRSKRYSATNRKAPVLTTTGPGGWVRRTHRMEILLAITLVNKKIASESTRVFYRSNYFYFSTPKVMGRFLAGIPSRRSFVRNVILNLDIPTEKHEAKRSIFLMRETKVRLLHLIIAGNKLLDQHAALTVAGVPGISLLGMLKGLRQVTFKGDFRELKSYLDNAEITKKSRCDRSDSDEHVEEVLRKWRKGNGVAMKKSYKQRAKQIRKQKELQAEKHKASKPRDKQNDGRKKQVLVGNKAQRRVEWQMDSEEESDENELKNQMKKGVQNAKKAQKAKETAEKKVRSEQKKEKRGIKKLQADELRKQQEREETRRMKREKQEKEISRKQLKEGNFARHRVLSKGKKKQVCSKTSSESSDDSQSDAEIEELDDVVEKALISTRGLAKKRMSGMFGYVRRQGERSSLLGNEEETDDEGSNTEFENAAGDEAEADEVLENNSTPKKTYQTARRYSRREAKAHVGGHERGNESPAAQDECPVSKQSEISIGKTGNPEQKRSSADELQAEEQDELNQDGLPPKKRHRAAKSDQHFARKLHQLEKPKKEPFLKLDGGKLIKFGPS